MLDTLEHGAYRSRRVDVENAGDATHLGFWSLAFGLSSLIFALHSSKS
jgi:hypothetical protein